MSATKNTIICVYDTTCNLPSELVTKLWDSINTHLTLPYDFLCLTNDHNLLDNVEVPTLPLRQNWGWPWSLMEVLDCETYNKECDVLYLDLGVTINGELDSVVRFGKEYKLCLTKKRGKRVINRYGTEMLWVKPQLVKYGVTMFKEDSTFFKGHYGRPSQFLGLVYPDTRTWPIKWTVEGDLNRVLYK